MSDERKYTEWEKIVAEQRAADRAIGEVFMRARALGGIEHVDMRGWSDETFPLPKVTRPRVVTDSYEFQWRINPDSHLVEWRGDRCGEWGDKLFRGGFNLSINAERAGIIADLLANPTEEVTP